MKKIIILLISIILCSCNNKNFKEGDIIFQTSQSKQSPLIAFATASNKTHCGIIVIKNNKTYVLETLGVIKLTPINEFINRGLFKNYWVKHINKKCKIQYKQYLGIPYDLAFKFNNNKFYCSELVYDIYKKQLNIELCKPKQLKNYNLLGLKKIINKRGMNINQCVVSPADLYNSDYFDLKVN